MPRSNFTVPGGATFDTSTLFIDDPNNRVGIATTSPGVTLDVAGVIRGSSGVIGLVTAGVPSVTIADGSFAVDSTNHNFYYRSGSTWRVVFDSGDTIGVANGGTGITSYAAGDLIYATGTTTLAKLAKGTANQVIGMNSGATAPEYKTVSGTADQITVTHGTGTITLSTPQSINTTSSPTFAGLTLSSDLAVNGADITTTSTGTATVFNTNATTVNIGGAATTLSLGASTGSMTINNLNVLVPTDTANIVLGASATTGDRLRLHRNGSNVFIDYSGTLGIRGYSGASLVGEVYVTNAGGIRHQYCGMISASSTQTINDATFTAINFNAAGTDYANMHDHVTNNSRVTIPIAGLWQFWAQVPFTDSVNGRRVMEIRRYNSAGTLQDYWRTGMDAGDTGTELVTTLTASFVCAVNDYVQVWYYHNSAANRLTISGFGLAPQFGWTLLRAS